MDSVNHLGPDHLSGVECRAPVECGIDLEQQGASWLFSNPLMATCPPPSRVPSPGYPFRSR